jgi:H+-transporting ATPase
MTFLNDKKGFTSDEVRRSIEKLGPNSVPETSDHPLLRAFGNFWAPVPWMLEAAVVLELCLGNYSEAGIIAVLLTFNAILGFFQEGRAQATLAALKSRLALNASVFRDNVWSIIPAVGLVPGDIVKLSLGAVVPADVRLIEGEVLLDQSLLTGESIPIEAGNGIQTYAGALVRRGEAVAEVTATGTNTKFGRTAQLVSKAHVESSQQKAVLRVVRNLAMFNGALIVLLTGYSCVLKLPLIEIIPLVLTALIGSIPVALPATFTLAAALGAQALGRLGVLPTRLSAVDEAASIDVLCVDKTGTLTQNELKVTVVRPMPGFNEAQVLGLAALASSEGGQDPLDAAIRLAAAQTDVLKLSKLIKFVPFDSTTKMSEAMLVDPNGTSVRVVKGAFSVVVGLTQPVTDASAIANQLQIQGFRVLAVGVGPPSALKLAGMIALSDPPRSDSSELISQLHTLGVRVVMLTGDAPVTAGIVAHAIGLDGKVSPDGPIPDNVKPEDFVVYAGILPEGKYKLVKAFQKSGHIVGMCGDGANDAPALRQAQMGIAVSTATDVAKSAAGIVLTSPGLSGIVSSIREGRITFQRILTYTLNSLTHKIGKMFFFAIGLVITGHAILTPMLMIISMLGGDLLGMSLTTDNVQPSPIPNAWRISSLTFAGVFMGFFEFAFCTSILIFGKFHLGFEIEKLQTLSFLVLVFVGQACTYLNRERKHLGSNKPSFWVVGASVLDLIIASTLAICGIAMSSLPIFVVGGILLVTVVFALILDIAKVPVFNRLKIA